MTQPNKPSYNTIPHYIAADYRSGKLKLNELMLLLWLRAIGNPYGFATTSLDALRDDIFPELKKNTVNSTLLKLRQKQYVYYELRQGRRGSFDVHINHWQTPKGGYKTLDKFFTADSKGVKEAAESSSQESYPQASSSEDSQKLAGQNQKLREMKSGLINRMSVNSESRPIRSYQHEHDTEHQIDNHDTLEKISFKRTLDYQPNPDSYEENECKRIALELKEEYINPILSILRKDGFRRIEQAWGIFREHKAEGKQMDNPARYFQGIIKKLRENR